MPEQGGFGMTCPLPLDPALQITMAHGGGGRVMHRLIEEVFAREFDNPFLNQRHDAARLPIDSRELAFTTDSYVVQPLFFPGGDIGSLAVHGTVNDLAMAGARPLYLSAAFILEEGFPIAVLRRIVESMRLASDAVGVQIVTGDTKVVNRRHGDGVFINTAGVGVIEDARRIAPDRIAPGDSVLVSGDLGRHGIAIMAVREGLEFETNIESDSAPVCQAVLALLKQGIDVHCLRDLTRGGLASALNELAGASACSIHLQEAAIPVREDVRGACELLGFDPLYVANEGRFCAVVAKADTHRALDVLREYAVDTEPAIIGAVLREDRPRVTLESSIGAMRLLDMLSGEQLPRIC